MKMPTDPNWYVKKAKLEDGCDVSAGLPPYIPGFVPSDADRHYERVIAKYQARLGWQTMETAPRDRPILIDISYWYLNDSSPTEVYVVAEYVESVGDYVWCAGDEVYHRGAVNGWIDIPKTSVKRDEL